MIILLFGLMGAGKTAIGKPLAKKLGMKFIELDHLILEQTGFDCIKKVYDYKMSLWKECEIEVCRDISTENNLVIACGGGIIENDLNLIYFQEHCPNKCFIYLQANPQTLIERIIATKGDKYKDVNISQMINERYQKRDILYRSWADKIIKTDKIPPIALAKKIAEKLQKKI